VTSDNNQKSSDSEAVSGEKQATEKQNQLKFEFSNMEPITPKKPVEEKPSFLDKAKSLLPKREHKEEHVNPSNPSSQPNLQANNTEQTEADIEQTTDGIRAETENRFSAEKVTREPSGNQWKKPETWHLLNRLPAKHRRLFIALLALFLVLLLFFWLKPSSTTTVDALQTQNSNALPIEFQPLNHSEEELVNQPAEQGTNAALLPNTVSNNAPSNVQNNTQSATPDNMGNVASTVATQQSAQQAQQIQQPPQQQLQQQATTPPRYEPPKEQAKPVTKPTTTAKTTPPPKAATKPATATTTETASGANRTLTIPQGVTLMQVFRNNNLNIGDVNAMTRANGADGVLSSFKPGDKVTIQLNAQGRVSRLTLQNGSSFSRNSDGSYNYKK
jgi:opacity associated protein